MDTLFDPTGWCIDVASSNYSGIKNVYSNEALTRMNGCEFHYNQSVQRQIKLLEEAQRSNFHNLAEQLLNATTPAAYVHTFGEMKTYIMSNGLKDQMTWLILWDKRKYFMFKAFVSIDGPSSNLAEVVHAGWKNSHAINLSLLRCAHEDIKCSLYIKQWMKDLRSGECIFWV